MSWWKFNKTHSQTQRKARVYGASRAKCANIITFWFPTEFKIYIKIAAISDRLCTPSIRSQLFDADKDIVAFILSSFINLLRMLFVSCNLVSFRVCKKAIFSFIFHFIFHLFECCSNWLPPFRIHIDWKIFEFCRQNLQNFYFSSSFTWFHRTYTILIEYSRASNYINSIHT